MKPLRPILSIKTRPPEQVEADRLRARVEKHKREREEVE